MSSETREGLETEVTAEQELRALAEEHPADFRAFADKADEPIRSRLFRLLEEADTEILGGEN